jgi:protein-disulfide isomerase
MASKNKSKNRSGRGSKGGGGKGGGGGQPRHQPKQASRKGGGRGAGAASAPAPAEPGGSNALSPAAFATALVLLLVATAAAVMLAVGGLLTTSLPGCGPESDCARAAASVWGSVPGVKWLTTASIGTSYFLGLLVAFIVARGVWPAGLRWVARLGVIGSVVLLGAMLVGGYVCMYCVTVHLANIAFVIVLEVGGRGAAPAVAGAGRSVVTAAALFVVAFVVLAGLERQRLSAQAERDQAELDDSMRAIVAGGTNGDGPPPPDAEPFTGRYRVGPEEAPIRIVIISDYQCPDCKRIESELRTVLASRDDVSFSAKHFPFCTDCNWKARKFNRNLHPNACWAARAAETAGILDGNDGFWRMHHWLFDRGGAFTDAELNAALPQLGFDPATFVPQMMGPKGLELVEQDIDEAVALGLRQTPMIFINGVELRGWRTPNALPRAVERIAATNPPPLTAASDRPPNALEKHIGDWREQPARPLPPDEHDWSRGPADAAAQVMVWGDYQEPYTAELDGRIRAFIATNPGVRYSFRHYPIDESCNPSATRTLHPLACRMAQAVEAAGRLGGVDAYWKMHEWVMTNQKSFSDAGLRAAASGMGLDPAPLLAEMESPEVASAIAADSTAARQLGLRGVPFMFVDSKRVPFWALEGQPLPERIIEEALAE